MNAVLKQKAWVLCRTEKLKKRIKVIQAVKTYFICFLACRVMLRLPLVGRTVARAAKGSLAPSTTGNIHYFLKIFSSSFITVIFSQICNRFTNVTIFYLCLHPAFNNSVYSSIRLICHGSSVENMFFLYIFFLNSSAGCQQHGGSVCGWKTCGGGAWNHCAAGEKMAQCFISVVFLFVNVVNLWN